MTDDSQGFGSIENNFFIKSIWRNQRIQSIVICHYHADDAKIDPKNCTLMFSVVMAKGAVVKWYHLKFEKGL